MTWMTQLITGRLKYCASCLMGLLFTAFAMGLFSGESANGQTVYEAPIHNFYSGTGGDGGHPIGTLIIDAQGNLYGTTPLGTGGAIGTVFEMVNNSGIFTKQILYSFHPTLTGGLGLTYSGDGAEPEAGLIMDGHGNLYGTTAQGGANSAGTVFELVCNAPMGQPCNYTEQIL